MAKMHLVPIRRGYWGKNSGLPHTIPMKLSGTCGSVSVCVEINQCVGCTRQVFTKSYLGDDAAVLARSSGKEPALSRHRAGVASMAWRTTR